MTTARRMIAFVLPATLLAALSGCALIEPAVTEEPPTALETCALGALWTLDLTTLEEQVTRVLTEEGAPVTAVDVQGSQTLDWTATSDMTITTDYTLTVTAQPSAEQIIVITETHGGSSSGKAYINGDVAIPRKWSGGDFAIEATATSNGEALETVPYTMPRLVVDDSVGLELTCTDGTMTVHPRGSDVTLTYSRG
jgi:hypothetical protein